MSTKKELEEQIKILEDNIEELQSLENNEKLMIEQSPDAMIYTDKDLKIVYINKKASKLLEYKRDELISKHINHISSDQNINGCIEQCSKEDIHFELDIIKKDKSNFYGEIKVTYLKDSENNNYGFLIVLRDISSLKKVQEDLKKSEEKYRKIIEYSTDNIIITKNGKILYLNPAVEKTMGYKNTNVIGTNFINYIAKDERKKIMDHHIKRLNGVDIENTYESVMINSTGEKIHIELNNSLIEIDGEACIISFIRDITNRKKEENFKLKNYEDKLKYQKQAMDLAIDGIAILDM
jgi:PAS domain S-box-containing protein